MSRPNHGWFLRRPYCSTKSEYYFNCEEWWGKDELQIDRYSATYEVLRRHPITGTILNNYRRRKAVPDSEKRNPIAYFVWCHGLQPWSELSNSDREWFSLEIQNFYPGIGKDMTAKIHDLIAEATDFNSPFYLSADIIAAYELQLISVARKTAIPNTGTRIVIVARIGSRKTLHFRIFDSAGTMILDKSEITLSNKTKEIEHLKNQLNLHWTQKKELTYNQYKFIIDSFTSITDQNLIYDEKIRMEQILRITKKHVEKGMLILAIDPNSPNLDNMQRALRNYYENQRKKPEKPRRTYQKKWLSIISDFQEKFTQKEADPREFPDDSPTFPDFFLLMQHVDF